MADTQIVAGGVRDPRVLEVMRRVPRHRFVPTALVDRAYADCPLPIGHGQTISQPFTVAFMCEAAELSPKDHVLEIGTGSGYAAAVLAGLCAHVVSIEAISELARAAQHQLKALGVTGVDIRHGDGALGAPHDAPFDAILVTARATSVPTALRDQLGMGGRLIMPIGQEGRERLRKITRTNYGRFAEEDLGAFSFVPLVGSFQ